MFLEAGLRCTAPLELEAGRWRDLTSRSVQGQILAWNASDFVWFVHMGPPCTRWSTARTTGRAGNATDRDGMTCARFSVRVLQACRAHEVYYTVEQPRSSGMWRWPPLARCLRLDGAFEVHFDTCQYGAPSRKPTTFCGTLPGLHRIGRKCCCSEHSERLQGTVTLETEKSPKTIWRTSLASK